MRLLIEAIQKKTDGLGNIVPTIIDSLDFTAQGIDRQAKALATLKAKYIVSPSALSKPVATTFRFHQCYNDENPSKPCITKEVS